MNLLPSHRNLSALDSFSNFDSVFDNFLRPVRAWVDDKPEFLIPSIDIHEKDDAYIVKADLPGMKKEDINVSLDNGVLTISAETKEESNEKKEGVIIRQERRIGQYLRRFDLGQNIDESDVSGEFKDGVLTLTVPKQKPQQSANRKIDIK